MANDDKSSTPQLTFRTTCWTDVLSARRESPDAEQSFAKLYQDYWPPLYGYLRRRGLSHGEAEELTQDFFVTLLQKDRLAKLERSGGRFRSFLLTAMQHFLANTWHHRQALKRGGGAPVRSLEETGIEAQMKLDDARIDWATAFDRDWALLVMRRALATLEGEWRVSNRQNLFAALRAHLHGDRSGRPYAELAGELEMTEGAVKVAVHRLRQRYGEILRQEIARTVGSACDVQDELRHLLRIVGN